MSKPEPIPRIRLLAALLSGLMLTASFPPASTDWLVWVALVPLLIALEGLPASHSFRLGFLAGAVHFLSLMYWIVVVLEGYGGLNAALSVLVLIALCGYLALYPAVFALLASRFRDARSGLLLTAGAWVGLEFLRGRLLTGLPWCFIGHSQVERISLIQVCDLVGVHGVSFLIAAVNVLVYRLFFDPRKRRNRTLVAESTLVAALLLLGLLYGHLRLREPGPAAKPDRAVRTAIIQGNIDQSKKWLPEYQSKTLAVYRRLSLQAAPSDVELMVWPETAVPFFFQEPSPLSAGVLEIPDRTEADLLFGSPAFEGSGQNIRYKNRAYLLSAKERTLSSYDKVHLVPFGEYVPLHRFFPFVSRLVPAAGDFSPGDRITPLQTPRYSAGVLICYEAIFPRLAIRQVEHGADVLVNLTNDAWFGRTSAPFQHLSMSVFRAVETRLPLVRAANTGISAFVDSRGRILRQSRLFREAVIVSDVHPSKGPPTFYARHGDLLPLFLLVAICVRLIVFGNNRRPRLARRGNG